MKNTQPGAVEVEEGGRIEGPTASQPEGPTVRGRLRKGYTMQIGSGRTGKTVFGPAIVSLDRDTARLHLHKFDNKAEIRATFGWPAPRPHLSLEESVQQRVDMLAARNRGRAGAAAAVAGPPVDAMVREAVTREVAALRAELPGLIAAAIAGAKPPAAPRAAPKAAAPRASAPAPRPGPKPAVDKKV